MGAASGILDVIRLSRTLQRTFFVTYELWFTCFKVEYKKLYTNETLIIDI